MNNCPVHSFMNPCNTRGMLWQLFLWVLHVVTQYFSHYTFDYKKYNTYNKQVTKTYTSASSHEMVHIHTWQMFVKYTSHGNADLESLFTFQSNTKIYKYLVTRSIPHLTHSNAVMRSPYMQAEVTVPGMNFTPIHTLIGITPWWITCRVEIWSFFLRRTKKICHNKTDK